MHMEVLSVSPELAAQWLKLNTNNRPLSKNTVQQLAAQIQRGEWQLTHQGIAFDEDDVLIDGQHRLAAIVKAGTTVPMTVTQGVPRTAFTVMDTGRKRTGRDALALVGEANATHLAAALRGLHLYLQAPNSAWSGGSSVTSNDQLLVVLEKHPGVRDALHHGIALNRACRITVTAATIGWYVTTETRPDIDQSAWREGVVTGALLKSGDPRLTLRNTMLSLAAGRTHRRRDDSREHLLYYLKSWNAWVEGRSMKLLRRSPNETMPRISNHTAAVRTDE
ncbi:MULTISPECIES: hypothetical protein [unclassified Streptomyces]|uniref:hypothetical protein n=2 Tax=Streptomyces TaxID=1883 RepID=UPI002DD7A25A|nr:MULTISPECIES: hypothetical protein [unclassified Streptomyces]WSC36112.1 hypothetical protein OHA08_11675 [Streptomyces sp. NBC_01763]WSC56805.1 hypothetical protein OG808_33660 [Streptomyces sp. NBC_01761]WSF87647.1 hypothetical protein OIE70_33775 [Streptomyces sp. NBC_01744]